MIAMLARLDYNTIVTVGDAIESFILTPDPSTKNCCLAFEKELAKVWNGRLESQNGITFIKTKKLQWFKAASWRRWTVSLILYLRTHKTTRYSD